MQVPSLEEILTRKRLVDDLKPISIYDLLSRQAAAPDTRMMRKIISGK